MSRWRTAKCLDVLLSEIDLVWPERSTAADGALGDRAHQARASDHNPDARGYVKARDFDITSLTPSDARRLADRIIATLVMRGQAGYVIFNRRISNPDIQGGAWRPYSGFSPHTEHIHVSVHTMADTTDPWGVIHTFQPDEGIDPMITTPDITRAVWSAQTGRGVNIAPMSLRVARAERDSAAAAAASRATLELVKVVAATVGVTADQVARILDTVTAPADDDVDPATAGGAA